LGCVELREVGLSEWREGGRGRAGKGQFLGKGQYRRKNRQKRRACLPFELWLSAPPALD